MGEILCRSVTIKKINKFPEDKQRILHSHYKIFETINSIPWRIELADAIQIIKNAHRLE